MPSSAVKILCVVNIIVLTVESPEEEPDCFGLSNSHDNKRGDCVELQMSFHPFGKGLEDKKLPDCSFSHFLVLLMNESVYIGASLNFIILTDMSSHPCVLFGLSALTIRYTDTKETYALVSQFSIYSIFSISSLNLKIEMPSVARIL